MIKTLKITLCWLPFLTTITAYAQVSANPATLPLDTAVRTGVLPNGFTYFIRHNSEPQKRVVMYLVNKAGSILEDEDQRGLAHFMEHMSFNGTTNFPHNDLVDYLQKSGVRFGADINAYTSFDETVYQLPLPADQPAVLAKGLLIMHDWSQSATLDPTEIDKERGVVLEEKRLGKGADDRMRRVYWPLIMNNSRYAERVPIGLDTVLDNFKRPTIARFYQDWYRPDLQALIIVGDINADSLETVIKAKFSDLKNPVNERTRPDYTIAIDGQNHFVSVTDKEMTQTVAQILIKHPAQPLKTAADYRQSIIQGLFNEMLGERFAEIARQANPPFQKGEAGISGFIANLDCFGATVVAKQGQLEMGLKVLWREIERVKRFGFTQTELERAKASYMNNMEDALKDKDKTNSISFVQEYQAYFLKGTASPGIAAEYQMVKSDLPAVSLKDLNELVARYIVNTNRDILVEAPDKDKSTLPDEATVNGWLKSVAQEKLTPYADQVSSKPLLVHQPKPGKIVNEQKDGLLNITTLTLSNGVKVILKPTDFKNDQTFFTGLGAGGTSLYSDADYPSASFASGVIALSGIGNFNQDQLSKYLEGKQVHVIPYISDRYEGLSGGADNKSLKTAMEMIYAYFTEPRKDTSVFANNVALVKAGLLNKGDDPKRVFGDTVTATLWNNNIRKTGPSLEKLNQVNFNKAFTIYKERFANAADFTFTFVGSFNVDTIKPLLEKYLGALPSTKKLSESKDLGLHLTEGRIEKTVYKGSEPQSSVIMVFSGDFDYNPEAAIKLDALKETLEIRLLQRLREDESGVYSPGVACSAIKFPKARYSFVITFGCGPQNVAKLIASTLDEINKIKANGPVQENIDKWRIEEKTNRETLVKTNDFWESYINDRLKNEESFDQLTGYNALLDKVTVDSLKDMASKYLSGVNYLQFVLKPETKQQ